MPRPAQRLADRLVVDVSRSLAGACTAWLLGRLGADVVQVCPAGAGTVREGAEPGPWDAGKRSIVLDPQDPHTGADDLATRRRLLDRADVLVAHEEPPAGQTRPESVVVLVPEPGPGPASLPRALALATRGAVAVALRLDERPGRDRVVDLTAAPSTRRAGGTPVAPDRDGVAIRRWLGTPAVDTDVWDDEGGPVDGERQVPHREAALPPRR